MTKRNRPRVLLERLEDRYLLSAISGINEFTVSSTYADLGSPVTGPDGNIWFAEFSTNKVGTINPTTHAVTQIALPNGFDPRNITVGPDGNLWLTGGYGVSADNLASINPTTHAITELTAPTASAGVNGIAPGPDGGLWFTEENANKIGRIDPTTHAIAEFPLPVANSSPFRITAGPDGNLWFTATGLVGEINPSSHAVSEYAVPTAGAYAYDITAGSDGALWFTESNTHKVGRIDPTTDAITEFPVGTNNSSERGITAGPDGNIWFSEANSSLTGIQEIGSINPTTDAVLEYPVHSAYASGGLQGITAGPDGNLWFADSGDSAIGLATLSRSQLIVTQSPSAAITVGSPFSLTVEAVDGSGNLDTSFNGQVTVALDSSPSRFATLGGTLTATATAGVVTFSGLTLSKPDVAGYGYTLYITGGGLGWGVTSPIIVTPAPASQLVITEEPPSSLTAGTGFELQAAIEDAYGNVVTSATNTVSIALASNPGGTSLGGTLTVTASQGLATFSGLTLTKAASGYTFQVTSSGLGAPVSTSLTVTPGAATGMLIAHEPTSVVVKTAFSLVVEAVDAYGNLVTSDNNTVTIALGNNPTGAKLGGTVSVKFVNGVATFSGLTMSKVGTGYTILISSKNLTGVTSDPFNVTAS